MRIYLDNCCFNRPFDDQSHVAIRIEAEAKLAIQDLVILKEIECIWSFVLSFENNKNPFPERRQNISQWITNCAFTVKPMPSIKNEANRLEKTGLKSMDALHVAAAISGNVDWFITTDKGILKREIPNIHIGTPIDFIQFWEDRDDN